MTTIFHLPESRIQNVQDEIAAHIRELPLFRAHAIPVASEDEGDLVSKIAVALDQGLGLFILVTIYEGASPVTNRPGPKIDRTKVVVGLWSNPTLHPDKPRIKPMLEHLATSLHLYQPRSAHAPLEVDDPLFKRLPWRGAIHYELFFRTIIILSNQTKGVTI